MNSFTCVFKVFAISLSNLWEGCFRKPKLLLVEDRLIYRNVSIGISKIHCPNLLARHGFLHRINIFEVKLRPVLKTIHGIYFMK